MRQVVIDTETTGFSAAKGDRMVEIAGVEILDDRITGRCFHSYLCPQRDSHPKAEEVHGLSTEFLIDKPLFKDIGPAFRDFIHGADVIAHNAGFDVSFINHEISAIMGRSYHMLDDCDQLTDTLAMARERWPGKKNSLDILCDRFNVNRNGRDKHGALIDAQLLAQVYLKMKDPNETGFKIDYEVPNETRKGYDQSHHLVRP